MKDNNITYVKSLGIFFMVMGHSGCGIPYATQTIYMFHMPLFFFLSGYCFKNKYFLTPFTFIKNRIKGLYFPYVKWSLFFLIFHNFLYDLHLYNVLKEYGKVIYKLSPTDALHNLYMIVTRMLEHDKLLGGFWFLNALFWGALIAFGSMICILSLTGRKKKQSIFSISCCILFIFSITIILNRTHYTIPYFKLGARPFLAALFYLFGYLFKIGGVNRLTTKQMLLAFVIVFICGFFWRSDTNFNFYRNSKMIPYILPALLGTWATFSVPFYRIINPEGRKLLYFIGDNTLVILALHFLCFKFVSYLIVIIYDLDIRRVGEHPTIHEYAQQGWWIVYVIVGIGIPVMLKYTYLFVANNILPKSNLFHKIDNNTER